jgi:predicted Zn-dependent protease
VQLRRLESIDKENVYALNNLAWQLRDSSPLEASEFAKRALEAAPNSPAVIDTYVTVMAKNGEFGEALRVLDRAIDAGRQADQLRLLRADVLVAQGDTEEAKRELTSLLRSSPLPAVKEQAERQLAGLSD